MIKQQFLKFIVIGVFSTLVNYITFYVLYQVLMTHYTLASATGFIIGVFSGYGFNKRWTFGVTEKAYQFIYKYYAVYIISLGLGLLFLSFLVAILGITPLIAQLLTIGLTTCTNFVGTKLWVFKK